MQVGRRFGEASLRSALCLRQPLAIARGRAPLRDASPGGLPRWYTRPLLNTEECRILTHLSFNCR